MGFFFDSFPLDGVHLSKIWLKMELGLVEPREYPIHWQFDNSNDRVCQIPRLELFLSHSMVFSAQSARSIDPTTKHKPKDLWHVAYNIFKIQLSVNNIPSLFKYIDVVNPTKYVIQIQNLENFICL